MCTTQLSLGRRGQLLSCATLIAMTLLTACDSDRATAPVKPVSATAPRAVGLIRGPSLSWMILEENSARVPIVGSEFQVTGPNNFKLLVTDDGAADLYAGVGDVKVGPLVPGQYTVCQQAAATGFMMDKVPCKVTMVSGGGASVGPFFNPRPPHVIWGLTDEVGNYIAGSQFGIADSLGTVGVNDNGLHDTNPITGIYGSRLWQDGEFTLCQKWVPAPFVLPAGGGCVKFLAHYGLTTVMGNFINVRPYSANWGVTDGNLDASNNYVPLAGAKFKVSYPNGLGSVNVDDNGQNDYDNRPGRVAVQLPVAGSYLICETQAPANHWLQKRPCNTHTVAYAVPKWVGWFINHEAQVPSS